MFNPRILSNARFSIRELTVEVCAREWSSTQRYDAMVNAEWERMLASRPELWDGTYYRVMNIDEWASAPAQKAMQLGEVSYRYIATFPALYEYHRQRELDPLNHLSTVALIQTGDGSYLFGRRAGNGATELIGGGVQSDELSALSGAHIEENFYKEIFEETGIRKDDMECLTGIGIVYSTTSNVLIVGHARTRLPADEIRTGFPQRGDNEMSDVSFIPESKLTDVLRRMPDYRSLIPKLIE